MYISRFTYIYIKIRYIHIKIHICISRFAYTYQDSIYTYQNSHVYIKIRYIHIKIHICISRFTYIYQDLHIYIKIRIYISRFIMYIKFHIMKICTCCNEVLLSLINDTADWIQLSFGSCACVNMAGRQSSSAELSHRSDNSDIAVELNESTLTEIVRRVYHSVQSVSEERPNPGNLSANASVEEEMAQRFCYSVSFFLSMALRMASVV